MLQIAVVDDERNIISEITQKLEQYFSGQSVLYRVHPFGNGQDFLTHEQTFDIIFLDIQINGLSGMDVAKALRKAGVKSAIIFITVLHEYVYDAFEVEASDFLLKPLNDLRFTRTMDRICNNLQHTDYKCLSLISKGNTCKLLRLKDIYYCEAVNHRIEIHMNGTVHECTLKMRELSEQLDSRFFLCHRSYFVNLDFVVGYSDGQAILTNGEKIPVSRLRGQEFSKAVLRRMKEEQL